MEGYPILTENAPCPYITLENMPCPFEIILALAETLNL
jgi:hypothetical protein